MGPLQQPCNFLTTNLCHFTRFFVRLAATEDADDGIDIYQQLSQLAGPLGNFYADTE
jgi:hypothetical protein